MGIYNIDNSFTNDLRSMNDGYYMLGNGCWCWLLIIHKKKETNTILKIELLEPVTTTIADIVNCRSNEHIFGVHNAI